MLDVVQFHLTNKTPSFFSSCGSFLRVLLLLSRVFSNSLSPVTQKATPGETFVLHRFPSLFLLFFSFLSFLLWRRRKRAAQLDPPFSFHRQTLFFFRNSCDLCKPSKVRERSPSRAVAVFDSAPSLFSLLSSLENNNFFLSSFFLSLSFHPPQLKCT